MSLLSWFLLGLSGDFYFQVVEQLPLIYGRLRAFSQFVSDFTIFSVASSSFLLSTIFLVPLLLSCSHLLLSSSTLFKCIPFPVLSLPFFKPLFLSFHLPLLSALPHHASSSSPSFLLFSPIIFVISHSLFSHNASLSYFLSFSFSVPFVFF